MKLSDVYNSVGVMAPGWSQDIHCPFEFRPQQLESTQRNLSFKRSSDYSEPGTGKTAPAIAWMFYYLGFGGKALVVMPPVLLIQFRKTVDSFTGHDFSMHTFDDGPKTRGELVKAWGSRSAGGSTTPDILLMSYERFTKDYKILKELGYNLLICDEAQNLKNHASQRHTAVNQLLLNHDSRYLQMTGTPIHTTPEDAYGLIQLERPGTYTSKTAFDKWYVQRLSRMVRDRFNGKERMISKVYGYKNLDHLHQQLYKNASRVLRKQVLPMKQPTVIRHKVLLGKEHLRLYNKWMNEGTIFTPDELLVADNAQQARQEALQMLTSPEKYFPEKVKNNEVINTIKELANTQGCLRPGPDNKLIIYTHFQESVLNFQKAFPDCALAYGGSNTANEVERFLHDNKVRTLIANAASGGAGLNLQDVSHTMVIAEPFASYGQFDQCVSRIFRSGQKNPVTIFLLDVVKTIAPKAIDSLLARVEVTKLINGEGSSLLDGLN